MLRVARKRLPGVRFVHGRMEDFRIGRRFDVVTCLFSAIGYVRSEPALRRTLRTLARHLAPEGVVIVEPWFTPQVYRVGRIHLASFGTKELPIARMNLSEKRANRSIMDMHYLVGTPRGVRHWVERHDLALFDVATTKRAFESVACGCATSRTD